MATTPDLPRTPRLDGADIGKIIRITHTSEVGGTARIDRITDRLVGIREHAYSFAERPQTGLIVLLEGDLNKTHRDVAAADTLEVLGGDKTLRWELR